MLELFLVTLMLEEKIKDILQNRKDYAKYLLFMVSSIYIDLMFEPHNTSKTKKELLDFYKNNKKYFKLEKEILDIIKNCKSNDECVKVCEDILNHISSIYFNVFNYNEWIFKEFSNAVQTRNYNNNILVEKKFEILKEENKKALIKKINEIGD